MQLDAGTLELGGLIGRSRTDGLLLNAGKSWLVRELLTVNDDGSETITPGRIELGLRTTNGVAGVIRNDARVIIDGAGASFGGFEQTLRYQHGDLSLRNGKVYESPNDYFRNAGTMSLRNAQFQLLGADNVFLNDGHLSIDASSYLRARLFDLNAGSLVLDGILDAEIIQIANANALTGGGTLKGSLVQLANGQALNLAGATLMTNEVRGSLNVGDGLFDVFVGVGSASVRGDLAQTEAGRLKFDWGSEAVDQLTIQGSATLGGGVDLHFLDGFVPDVGQSLEVLMADALFGRFDDNALVYDRSLGRSFAFRYFGNSVFIDVGPAPIPLPASIWVLASACGVLALRRRACIESHRLRCPAASRMPKGRDATPIAGPRIGRSPACAALLSG